MPAIAGKLVKLKLAGAEFKGCCPFHADRTPSFTIYSGGQRFQCFGCGAAGDVLDFVRRAYSVSLPEAAQILEAGNVPRAAVSGSKLAALEKRDRSPEALAVWQRAEAAAGTLAEAYLRSRGINPPYPAALRFLRLPCGNLGQTPCLICAVQDVGGAVTGIQRIFLAQDGQGKADLPKPKLSLGAIKGGAIRLGDLDGSGCLTVCEGPEDGLSLLEIMGGPVWVSAGTTFLPAMQFPPEVRSIVIGADNDSAGREAADKAARAFVERGLSVRIIRPLPDCKDFNDELRSAAHGC
nr:CHC2 zinc finger domain-containing protein [Novosphingobium ginsenosidimutans]